jgi:hypothetical protein
MTRVLHKVWRHWLLFLCILHEFDSHHISGVCCTTALYGWFDFHVRQNYFISWGWLNIFWWIYILF